MGREFADESVQVLKEVHQRIHSYLALWLEPLQKSAPLFASTACVDRGGNVVTADGNRLSTRSIHRIITERFLLAGVKASGIVVHSLRQAAATYATLNGAPPSQVQRMMRRGRCWRAQRGAFTQI